jgi:transcriptional regulator with XRE-family HTH domain
MTQRQVADRCGIRHPHLSALECGRTRPTLDTIQRIADALDCDAAVTITPRALRREHNDPN